MNTFSHVPPGFRFHPTDEELVDYYLRKKIHSRRIDLDVIKDVDLYKIEPWDLQEICRIGTEEQSDWYFFSHKDKKYPTGTRTNRATAAGFWKATGRDKSIYAKHELIGMRKTLVFYKGRAPNGQKSDWIMHEYRLETDENGTPQEEGWVVCRVFKKRIATMRKIIGDESPIWYDDHHVSSQLQSNMNLHYQIPQEHFLQQLPLLESPKMLPLPTSAANNVNMIPSLSGGGYGDVSNLSGHSNYHSVYGNNYLNNVHEDQVTDWRVLDKFVASQLSQDEVSKESDQYSNTTNTFTSDDSNFMVKQLEKQDWDQ